MKKKISVGLVVTLLFTLGIYVYAEKPIEKEGIISADHLIFEDYKDALKYSDLVLEVTATDNSVNVIEDNPDFETGHTLTKVVVNRVIEQKPEREDNYSLEEGSTIDVMEPTYTITNGAEPGVIRLNYEDYTRIEADSKYILFLVWDENREAYWINSLEQGKFNIDNSDKRERSVAGVSEQYEKLKEDVLRNTMN